MRGNKYSAIINLSGVTDYLSPLTDYRPIAGLPFACRYRVIDFMLSSLNYAGIESAALFIDESGRSIYDHVRSGKEWDFDATIKGGLFTFSQQVWKRFDYIHQERTYDFYMDHHVFLDKGEEPYVVVMGGEIVQTIDVDAIYKHHLAQEADITVVYKIAPHETLNGVELDSEGYVTAITNDNNGLSLANVFFLKKDKLKEILRRANDDRVYENLTLVIKKYLQDYKVSAFEYTGFMEPIHSVQNYFEVSMKLLDLGNYNALFHSSIPILTKSQSGAPTYYRDGVVVRNSQVATNCLLDGHVENTFIFRKVVVEKDAFVKDAILMSGCTIGEGAQLQYVILDKGVTVDPGVVLKGTKDQVLVIEKNTHVTQDYAQ